MDISDNLLSLFGARVQERDGSYVVEVPEREVTVGDLEENDTYRVAIVATDRGTTSTTEPKSTLERERDSREPPVEEGEIVDVEIEDIGDQGDGIARVGPGYVVIVPDTERDERVAVEMNEVRENMAFAEVIERYDRM